ncbi:MAG: VOC family protein [Candidatus Solibacter sp.]|nr:VOC family protein [Candidatus Solibacter sp.]
MSNPVKAVPEGYHSVTPYLVVQGAGKLIDFMKAAFGAREIGRLLQPDGTIGHTEMRIGDSPIMLSEAREQWKAMPTTLYLYLEDVDAAYARALAAGATPVMEPKNQFYGDRSGGVQDMCGNFWWVATRIEDLSEDELKRRHQAARGGQ